MKSLAAILLTGLTFAAWAESTSSLITSVDEAEFKKGLNAVSKRSVAQTLDETYEALASDALIFESGDNKGEITVEANGVALKGRPGKCKFKNIVLRTSENLVNKKVVVRGWDVKNKMIIEATNEDQYRFRTTRSIKISDANLVDCKDCPEVYSGYAHKGIITTRDPGRNTFPGGARDAGSGLATGRRVYTGGRKVEVPDAKLISDWMKSFLGEGEKRIELEFTNPDEETIAALSSAKYYRVKVKFPTISQDIESARVTKLIWSPGTNFSTMIVEFAIKENGIK